MDLLHWILAALLTVTAGLLVASRRAQRQSDRTAQSREAIAEALRQREQMLSMLIERMPGAVVISDLDSSEILVANPAGYEPLGFTRDQFVGKKTRELDYWVSWQQRKSIAERVARGESPTAEPIRVKDTAGNILDWELSVARFDFQGKRLGIWLSRDVTEEKRAKEALAKTLARQEKILATLPDPFTITDLATGSFIEVSPAWEEATGLTRAEAVGKTSVELGVWHNPDDRAILRDALAKNKVVRNLRLVFTRVNPREGQSKLFIAESNATLFELDEKPHLLLIVRDIGEREKLEDEVRASRDRFVTMFANNPTPLGLTDMNTRLQVDANAALLGLLGYTRDEYIGCSSQDIQLWADLDDRKRAIASTDALGHVGPIEAKFRRKDGQVLICQLQGRILDIEGKRLFLWSVYDLTALRTAERKLTEINQSLEQRVVERTLELTTTLNTLRRAQSELVRTEKLAALGELVAGVAHELNTPIGNSVTVASTLQDKAGDIAKALATGTLGRSGLNDFVDTTVAASNLLMRNLGQAAELVASFKQVAVDRASEARRHFNLADTVNDVLSTLSPNLKRQPHRVELRIPPDIEFDSYPGAFGQIVSNLVMNAYLHAFDAEQPGTLVIGAEPVAGDAVHVTFSDDGRGIPDPIRHRVFDPFFTTRFGQGGSGLGLHIVHNLATRLLGGHIALDSVEGRGTTFSLTLPRVAPSEISPESQADAALR